MHSFEALIEKIDNYHILKKPYQSNDEEINLYDLYSILCNSHDEMMTKLYQENNLEDILNKSRSRKEKYLGGIHYSVEYCKWTSKPSISIDYSSIYNPFIHANANISRGLNGVEIFYKKDRYFDSSAIKSAFDIINQKLDILEEYGCIHKKDQVFSCSDELYKAYIFLKKGKLDVDICLNDHVEDIIFRKNISDELIHYNSNYYNRLVLQRMHVKIDSLPENFQILIYNYKKKNESKQKIKTIGSY